MSHSNKARESDKSQLEREKASLAPLEDKMISMKIQGDLKVTWNRSQGCAQLWGNELTIQNLVSPYTSEEPLGFKVKGTIGSNIKKYGILMSKSD